MQVTLSSYTIDDMLQHFLEVEGMDIDLGESPNGGRYYQRLESLLEQIADEDEDDWISFEDALHDAALDGVRDFLRERGDFLRTKLAEKIAWHKARIAADEAHR